MRRLTFLVDGTLYARSDICDLFGAAWCVAEVTFARQTGY
ncbi:hypothetical protein AS9A_3954 [Hoyosella subflava DQS3-9A1]|uniref:Uncharacterized protein n=1 Tax=Hoyosella subflava (strain DSM 45089 / JCM 17490 / NBRC 109087 / DQS3-9A1) TaxID=443218 RepID=F6EHM6_HOYSD|nr:hypothetical protein AS9A_3954 [Hoyosella subflava DQS3-9A1]